VRLLAPHFGDSAYVWTDVIGVILVALAAGAWCGGLLADRGARRALPGVLWAAAALAALVPFGATPIGGWLLPQDLPLDAAFPALVRGSLAATLLLFAPPAFCLGCVSPMLVARLAQDDRQVGRAAGLVSAMATAGSLAGTFAATHLLIPELGSRATVWLSAAVVGACAALAQSRRRGVAAAAALPFGAMLLPLGPLRPAADGTVLLAEVESPYQFLQVVRTRDESPPATLLKINEGLDSFHSVALDGTAWTGGRYYDWHVVAPFLAGDGERPAPLRVLSLGAAAGSFARLYAQVHPGAVVDGVEIDPAVVALGERWFGGTVAPGEVYAGLDARVFVARARAQYDVLLLDAYERQIYIPPHVASRQFFAAAAALLRPGGVLSINVGGLRFDDRVPQAIAATLAEVFGEAWLFKVPRSRNLIALARRERPVDPPALLAGVATGEPLLRDLLAQLARPDAWRRVGRGGASLDDDRPLLDELHDLSYRREHRRGPWPIGGSMPEADAAAAAATALAAQDGERALAAIAGAAAASARLRSLAGDARWWLRDLAGARDEYAAGLALAAEPELRAELERKRQAAVLELAVVERSAGIAARNGTVALIALLPLGGAVAWILQRLRRRVPLSAG
jgi:spermidine synthase